MEATQTNSEDNSEAMYSARDLAEMHLPRLPDTERAWLDRAKNGGWKFREVPGRGRGGIKRIYLPPPEIQALIDVRQRGESPIAPPQTARIPAGIDEPDDGCVAIDNYVNVRGSAGPGAEAPDEAIVKVRVDARLLRERIGSNFGKIKIASVSGDSMEPTLSHGDQVLVDTSCSRFIDDAIYAIQQDGHLRFKRIHLKLDGSIEVRSDSSPHVETYNADVASRFYVVGMVIPFKFGRFKV